VQRIRRRYAEQLPQLPAGVPHRTDMQTLFEVIQNTGASTSETLRTVRQLVLERLVCLDCDHSVDLQTVTHTMTALAEWALDVGFEQSCHALDATHGAPMGGQGLRAQLCIVGMGKLGARELNVSSDIDLIYVYDFDGETAGDAHGRGRISNQEYFGKLVRAVYTLIGDTTEHGFVFRVEQCPWERWKNTSMYKGVSGSDLPGSKAG
jgi:[glutamine synthetase] adenylyltransferase / [glutamine synthetase]-adenylyl-L-tyrosine phosphorylase